jgi:adenylylsulfate kinase
MAMTQRILIMGLPGSGKTYLAGALKKYLEENGTYTHSDAEVLPITGLKATVAWFNADDIRHKFNDWDFSDDGRIRQSLRMFQFSMEAGGNYAICDFVAPLVEMRNNFKADWTVWMDTIREGRYADTNAAFVEPDQYDFRITEQNAEKWAEFIGQHIVKNRRRPTFDWKKETVQMLGRWQPWHDGHRALFERLITRTGQVVIQIRDVQGWQDSNPFAVERVKAFIRRDLDPVYQGQYEIQVVPNIVHIGWGRGVGYTSAEEIFDKAITDISATKIRRDLGLK